MASFSFVAAGLGVRWNNRVNCEIGVVVFE